MRNAHVPITTDHTFSVSSQTGGVGIDTTLV